MISTWLLKEWKWGVAVGPYMRGFCLHACITSEGNLEAFWMCIIWFLTPGPEFRSCMQYDAMIQHACHGSETCACRLQGCNACEASNTKHCIVLHHASKSGVCKCGKHATLIISAYQTLLSCRVHWVFLVSMNTEPTPIQAILILQVTTVLLFRHQHYASVA